MVAGAEGESGLDLDADTVGLDACAVVRAVDDETAGLDRLEAIETFSHPVGRRERLERERVGELGAGRQSDQGADGRFVGRFAKIERERPAPVRRLVGRDRDGLGIEAFREHVGNLACGRRIGR